MSKKIQEQLEAVRELIANEDMARMWKKLHTPLVRTSKVGRNDICPYCNSGKKFKNCECYKTHSSEYTQK